MEPMLNDGQTKPVVVSGKNTPFEWIRDEIELINFDENNKKCTNTTNNNIIDNCACLQRLCQGLKHYNNNQMPVKHWIEFCLNIYGHQMLDDYSHLLSTHYDSVEQIKNELIQQHGFEVCSIQNCELSCRHFNRNNEKNLKSQKQYENAICAINIYQQEYDSLHFNLFHLFEVGYRFKKQQNDAKTDEYNKYISCIDYELTKMINKISNDRDKYKNVFERFRTKKQTGKYNINVGFDPDTENANPYDDNKTFIDKVFEYLTSNEINASDLVEVHKFLCQQEYDSESIQEDTYDGVNSSNIFSKMKNIKCIDVMNKYIKCSQDMKSTFSTGLIFYYWHHFDAETAQDQTVEDFYNIKDYVPLDARTMFISSGKYQNLKEEAINSGYCGWIQFEERVVQKANIYIHTDKVKQIKAMYAVGDQAEKYGIATEQQISLQHLHSVILYTDFSKLCKSFSAVFRPAYFGELLESIKKRNKRYYYLSKRLRETVECFGNAGGKHWDVTHEAEYGPFYCGMNHIMALPNISIRLCGPTSTSKQREIGVRFADVKGIVIRLNTAEQPTSFSLKKHKAESFCGDSGVLLESRQSYGTFFDGWDPPQWNNIIVGDGRENRLISQLKTRDAEVEKNHDERAQKYVQLEQIAEIELHVKDMMNQDQSQTNINITGNKSPSSFVSDTMKKSTEKHDSLIVVKKKEACSVVNCDFNHADTIPPCLLDINVFSQSEINHIKAYHPNFYLVLKTWTGIKSPEVVINRKQLKLATQTSDKSKTCASTTTPLSPLSNESEHMQFNDAYGIGISQFNEHDHNMVTNLYKTSSNGNSKSQFNSDNVIKKKDSVIHSEFYEQSIMYYLAGETKHPAHNTNTSRKHGGGKDTGGNSSSGTPVITSVGDISSSSSSGGGGCGSGGRRGRDNDDEKKKGDNDYSGSFDEEDEEEGEDEKEEEKQGNNNQNIKLANSLNALADVFKPRLQRINENDIVTPIIQSYNAKRDISTQCDIHVNDVPASAPILPLDICIQDTTALQDDHHLKNVELLLNECRKEMRNCSVNCSSDPLTQEIICEFDKLNSLLKTLSERRCIKQSLLSNEQNTSSKGENFKIQLKCQTVNNAKLKKNKGRPKKSKSPQMYIRLNSEPYFQVIESIRKVHIPDKLIQDIKNKTKQIFKHDEDVKNYMNSYIGIQPEWKEDCIAVNFGFIDKNKKHNLYCKVVQQEFGWKMDDKLFTRKELSTVRSIGKTFRFKTTEKDINLNVEILWKDCKWKEVPIFNRKNNNMRFRATITKEKLIKKVKENNLYLIQIISYDRIAIDFVLIIKIHQYTHIGLSLNIQNEQAKINGVYADKDYLLQRHYLVNPQHMNECKCLDAYEFIAHDVQIDNPDVWFNKVKHYANSKNKAKGDGKRSDNNSTSSPSSTASSNYPTN